ncbi:MAG TPA: ATP synthase F1 subunit delta [bacterium]|nr:ATP synthase F1 subunit delta [bacterium]
MKISSKQYALSLFELVADKNDSDLLGILKNFTNFVIKNNDYSKIDNIIEELSKIWDEKNSELSVDLISAHKLENDTKDIITTYLKNKTNFSKINFTHTINTDIIGGIILRYGDKIIDGSIKNNLNNLKNKINK